MLKTKTILLTLLLCVMLPLHAKDNLLDYADSKDAGKYVRKHFVELLNKPFNTHSTKKKALLMGDSHAQDFLNMVTAGGKLNDYQIRTVHVFTQCQLYLGDAHQRFIQTKDQPLCESGQNLAKNKDKIANADLIILAANWKKWSATELPNTIKNLALRDDQDLLVIGRKNLGRVNIRYFLRKSEEQRISHRNKVDSVQVSINQIMQKGLVGVKWIDLHQLACGSSIAKNCPVFTPEGELISFDGGHLTPAGAKFYGDQLNIPAF